MYILRTEKQGRSKLMFMPFEIVSISSLQCYSVLSDILVKNELHIQLERGSNVLSSGEGFICLSPPSKLNYLQNDNFVQCYSVLSDFHPMANDKFIT